MKNQKNPRLSAYVQIFGTFDFNEAFMASPGTKIIAHEKPTQRATWRKYGVSGWYIGPELEHYRCYKVFVMETISERIADVMIFPQRMPIVKPSDAATLAAQDLVESLQNPIPNAPFATINDTHHTKLRNLMGLLNIIPKGVG